MCSWLERFSFSVFTILLCSGFSAAADLDSAKGAYEQKDYATALKEFAVLAEQGSDVAQLTVGKMYMIGEGVTVDRDQAIRWFKAAAVQGNADAQFFLGAMYLLPQKDIGEGLKWLRLSAEQGLQDAQYLLAKAYLEDLKDHPRDPVQAGVWMRLAAKDNKQFYQNELGVVEGQLTPDQVAKAKALAAEWKPKPASNVTKN